MEIRSSRSEMQGMLIKGKRRWSKYILVNISISLFRVMVDVDRTDIQETGFSFGAMIR